MSHVDSLIAEDITAYLEAHENKSLLRFITCGSVDDGKSTLIGRLLYDSKLIFEDQLTVLEADAQTHGTRIIAQQKINGSFQSPIGAGFTAVISPC